MGLSIARLRMGLVLGAALVVLTIAGFLGYARYRTHRFLAGLPSKLGIDVRRETDGYTFSKSVGPNTTMTLHASKAVEHRDGKLTLHDVSMVLYGRKQDRADRISGAEFEYDQQAGVVRAMGEVHIDLEAPAAGQERPSVTNPLAESEDKRIIHVKTSGLVFLQKLGVAATDQPLEFRFGALTGQAHGAEYNSDTGIVILQSKVEAHGEQHGAPVTLRASHAELNRPGQQAVLTDAVYASAAQTAQGDRAVVHLRGDSSPDRIEAEGHVALAGKGTAIHAATADVILNAKGQAESAHLSGGVRSEQAASLREARSESDEARVAFDSQGLARTVLLTGKVHVAERGRTTLASAWSARDATAGRMIFALDQGALRQVDATGNAHVTLQEPAAKAGNAVSELSGDALRGRFANQNKVASLVELQGAGHTVLHRNSPDGADQTSAGNTLQVLLLPAKPGQTAADTIQTATQTGHVVLTSKAPPKPGTAIAEQSRGTAELAVYNGAADTLTLSGAAELDGDASRLTAGRIVLAHATGDAVAEGDVKATYRQSGSTATQRQEPVHVVAERAEFQHQASRALFYGKQIPARIWQGASQVEAPVLELEQAPATLIAHGDRAGGDPAPVHAVLVNAQPEGKKTGPAVVRVAGRTMVYREDTRQVQFAGDVAVQDAQGTLRAAEATAFLQPADASQTDPKAGPKAAPNPDLKPAAKATGTASKPDRGIAMGGGVERIVARGKVELEQPGRRGTGEQLVFTQADGLFVLTGTPALRPRIVDDTQGVVTGQALRFHTTDRSVEVVGGIAPVPGERVRTVTRVKQR